MTPRWCIFVGRPAKSIITRRAPKIRAIERNEQHMRRTQNQDKKRSADQRLCLGQELTSFPVFDHHFRPYGSRVARGRPMNNGPASTEQNGNARPLELDESVACSAEKREAKQNTSRVACNSKCIRARLSTRLAMNFYPDASTRSVCIAVGTLVLMQYTAYYHDECPRDGTGQPAASLTTVRRIVIGRRLFHTADSGRLVPLRRTEWRPRLGPAELGQD